MRNTAAMTLIRSFIIFACLGLGIVLTACKNHESDCAERIRRIQVGSTRVEAEDAVKRCGFTVSYDEKTNTLYCDKKEQGLIMERTQISIKFDDKNQVSSVVVTPSLIGP